MTRRRRFLRGLVEVVKYGLLIVAFVAAASFVFVLASKEGTSRIDEQNRSRGVSPTKVDLITMGMTPERVKHILGDPDRTETRDVKGLRQSDCWDYRVQNFRRTQICFGDDDKVDYKVGGGSQGG